MQAMNNVHFGAKFKVDANKGGAAAGASGSLSSTGSSAVGAAGSAVGVGLSGAGASMASGNMDSAAADVVLQGVGEVSGDGAKDWSVGGGGLRNALVGFLTALVGSKVSGVGSASAQSAGVTGVISGGAAGAKKPGF